MSIKYPSNAQMFNINGINGGNVVDSWSMVASRFKSVPRWFYTKTKKAKKNYEQTGKKSGKKFWARAKKNSWSIDRKHFVRDMVLFRQSLANTMVILVTVQNVLFYVILAERVY